MTPGTPPRMASEALDYATLPILGRASECGIGDAVAHGFTEVASSVPSFVPSRRSELTGADRSPP